MNTIWGAELHYAPDYWPLWLIYAGVVVLLMLVWAGYPCVIAPDAGAKNGGRRRAS